MTPPDRPAPQPAPDLDALLSRLGVHSSDYARDAYDAITSLRAQLAEAQAMSQKYQIAYGEEQDGRHREFNRATTLRARVAELEAALDFYACVDHYPMHGAEAVWRLVKLSDGNEAVAAFDGVGLLSKKRWQTKVFLTHRPASPSPINDLVMQQACDVFLIADLENGVYPTHFRPNDTVFGLPALKGAAT